MKSTSSTLCLVLVLGFSFQLRTYSAKGSILHSMTVQIRLTSLLQGANMEQTHLNFLRILTLFPDANLDLVKRLCLGTGNTEEDFLILVDRYLEEQETNVAYLAPARPAAPPPKPTPAKVKVILNIDTLYQLLPDADRKYLREKFQTFDGDLEKLQTFVDEAVQTRNYPTLKEAQRKEKLLAQVREYTTDFKVRKFVSMFPDPKAHFEDPKRKPAVWGTGSEYALVFLRNEFRMLSFNAIDSVIERNKQDLIKTVNALQLYEQSGDVLKFRRKFCRLPATVDNIPLLQEIAYIRFQWRINNYLKGVKAREAHERKGAQKLNLMQSCNCCYEDELLPSATVTCPKGCKFCKTCVQKSVEIAYGMGKLDFPCLSDCGTNFSLKKLQLVLEPNLFIKVALKKQTEEIKACGIDELEMCPFCDFATIPIKGDQLFRCSNLDCLRESCRLCKEPSHIPLRCDEVEKEDEVKSRVYIENKMSEALIRKCNKCGLAIIKEDGCNKMTCSCGTLMCYICRKTIQNYSHFDQSYNPEGINYPQQPGLCPLYSKDLERLHKENVMAGVQQAKAELGLNADSTTLKYDPSADLDKYYK